MKLMTLKLPDHLDQRLSTTAQEQGTTKSALVRDALEAFLIRRGRRAKAVSCLDLTRDLVGSVEGPEESPVHERIRS